MSSFNYDQIPAGYYDQVAKSGKGIQKYWHRFKFQFLIDRIEKIYKKSLSQEKGTNQSLKVVDLGCGPGTFLGLLRNQIPIDGIGIDIAPAQIKYARNTYGSDQLIFMESTFDAPQVLQAISKADIVTIVEVIEHIHLAEIVDSLTRIRGLLKPGAKLIITTPNYVSLWPVLELAVNFLSKVNYEEQHITQFNRWKLKALLADLGFKEIKVGSFIQISPFVAGFLGGRVGEWARKVESRLTQHLGPLLWAEVESPEQLAKREIQTEIQPEIKLDERSKAADSF